MIIEKPSIFIYVDAPDSDILKQVCAGIEEEGLFYEIKETKTYSLDKMAWNAAADSMLGSGIGIRGTYIALQMRGLDAGHNIESYSEPTQEQSRNLGANSARAIKKQAFKYMMPNCTL